MNVVSQKRGVGGRGSSFSPLVTAMATADQKYESINRMITNAAKHLFNIFHLESTTVLRTYNVELVKIKVNGVLCIISS